MPTKGDIWIAFVAARTLVRSQAEVRRDVICITKTGEQMHSIIISNMRCVLCSPAALVKCPPQNWKGHSIFTALVFLLSLSWRMAADPMMGSNCWNILFTSAKRGMKPFRWISRSKATLIVAIASGVALVTVFSKERFFIRNCRKWHWSWRSGIWTAGMVLNSRPNRLAPSGWLSYRLFADDTR